MKSPTNHYITGFKKKDQLMHHQLAWILPDFPETSNSHVAPKDSVWGLPDSPDDTPAVSASVTPTPTRLRGAVPAPSPAGKVAAGWPIFGW